MVAAPNDLGVVGKPLNDGQVPHLNQLHPHLHNTTQLQSLTDEPATVSKLPAPKPTSSETNELRTGEEKSATAKSKVPFATLTERPQSLLRQATTGTDSNETPLTPDRNQLHGAVKQETTQNPATFNSPAPSQPLSGQSSHPSHRPLGNSEATVKPNLDISASQNRPPESHQPIVNRLTVEASVAESGERIKLQVSLPPRAAAVPTVQISVKVGNEQLASQLAQQFPTLRQHLLEQGIVLAQWVVTSGGWEGGRRDPAEHFGDWRRLPSASHNRLPTNFIPDEGIWA
jgi:hypothetical protein